MVMVCLGVFSLRIRNARSSAADIAFDDEMVVLIPDETQSQRESSPWASHRASWKSRLGGSASCRLLTQGQPAQLIRYIITI